MSAAPPTDLRDHVVMLHASCPHRCELEAVFIDLHARLQSYPDKNVTILVVGARAYARYLEAASEAKTLSSAASQSSLDGSLGVASVPAPRPDMPSASRRAIDLMKKAHDTLPAPAAASRTNEAAVWVSLTGMTVYTFRGIKDLFRIWGITLPSDRPKKISLPRSSSCKSFEDDLTKFQHDFLKVEDQSGLYKPLIKEWKPIGGGRSSMPRIHFEHDSPQTHWPLTTGAHSSPFGPLKVEPAASRPVMFRQARQQIQPSKNRKRHVSKAHDALSGWCECCNLKYSKGLEQHRTSSEHQAFIQKVGSYASVDGLISCGLSLQDLLKRERARLATNGDALPAYLPSPGVVVETNIEPPRKLHPALEAPPAELSVSEDDTGRSTLRTLMPVLALDGRPTSSIASDNIAAMASLPADMEVAEDFEESDTHGRVRFDNGDHVLVDRFADPIPAVRQFELPRFPSPLKRTSDKPSALLSVSGQTKVFPRKTDWAVQAPSFSSQLDMKTQTSFAHATAVPITTPTARPTSPFLSSAAKPAFCNTHARPLFPSKSPPSKRRGARKAAAEVPVQRMQLESGTLPAVTAEMQPLPAKACANSNTTPDTMKLTNVGNYKEGSTAQVEPATVPLTAVAAPSAAPSVWTRRRPHGTDNRPTRPATAEQPVVLASMASPTQERRMRQRPREIEPQSPKVQRTVVRCDPFPLSLHTPEQLQGKDSFREQLPSGASQLSSVPIEMGFPCKDLYKRRRRKDSPREQPKDAAAEVLAITSEALSPSTPTLSQMPQRGKVGPTRQAAAKPLLQSTIPSLTVSPARETRKQRALNSNFGEEAQRTTGQQITLPTDTSSPARETRKRRALSSNFGEEAQRTTGQQITLPTDTSSPAQETRKRQRRKVDLQGNFLLLASQPSVPPSDVVSLGRETRKRRASDDIRNEEALKLAAPQSSAALKVALPAREMCKRQRRKEAPAEVSQEVQQKALAQQLSVLPADMVSPARETRQRRSMNDSFIEEMQKATKQHFASVSGEASPAREGRKQLRQMGSPTEMPQTAPAQQPNLLADSQEVSERSLAEKKEPRFSASQPSSLRTRVRAAPITKQREYGGLRAVFQVSSSSDSTPSEALELRGAVQRRLALESPAAYGVTDSAETSEPWLVDGVANAWGLDDAVQQRCMLLPSSSPPKKMRLNFQPSSGMTSNFRLRSPVKRPGQGADSGPSGTGKASSKTSTQMAGKTASKAGKVAAKQVWSPTLPRRKESPALLPRKVLSSPASISSLPASLRVFDFAPASPWKQGAAGKKMRCRDGSKPVSRTAAAGKLRLDQLL